MKTLAKFIFLIVCFCNTNISTGQKPSTIAKFPIDSATGKYAFIDVVKIENTSASELFSRAKLFVAEAYNSAKTVTDLTDESSKLVLIKPRIFNHVKGFLVNDPYGSTIYQIKIECKDGRYRYEISNFYHTGLTYGSTFTPKDGGELESDKGAGFTKNTWQQIKDQAYDESILIIDKLKKRMSTKQNNDF